MSDDNLRISKPEEPPRWLQETGREQKEAWKIRAGLLLFPAIPMTYFAFIFEPAGLGEADFLRNLWILCLILLLAIIYSIYCYIIIEPSDNKPPAMIRYEKEMEKYELNLKAIKEKAELEQENIIKKADNYIQKGGLENLRKAANLYLGDLADMSLSDLTIEHVNKRNELIPFELKVALAKEQEKLLDYDTAIKAFKNLGMHDDAKRVRQKMMEKGSVNVSQKVVHGDEVTEIKDSVISKSSIGGGSSKMQELEKLTEMKEKGLIDDDEFKQMKKEILGK